jgi:hypothetical protein
VPAVSRLQIADVVGAGIIISTGGRERDGVARSSVRKRGGNRARRAVAARRPPPGDRGEECRDGRLKDSGRTGGACHPRDEGTYHPEGRRHPRRRNWRWHTSRVGWNRHLKGALGRPRRIEGHEECGQPRAA